LIDERYGLKSLINEGVRTIRNRYGCH
jgi:hypothetical protein